MRLTGDGHVHSEWSWDTGGPLSSAAGTMVATCAQAVRIGLPALAFTDHLDLRGFLVDPDDLDDETLRGQLDADGVLTPVLFDAAGYHDGLDRVRHRYPELRILSGVEFGQPHLDEHRAGAVVELDALDRINGSLHTLPIPTTLAPPGHDQLRAEPMTLFRHLPADEVVRNYLTELIVMIETSQSFTVLCHLDYAVRYWPLGTAGPFDPRRFEEEFRAAMRTLAGTERALEFNVSGQLRPWILRCWREEGGQTITIGSDAHGAEVLAQNFYEAMAIAESYGFRPGRHPEEVWHR